MIHYIFFGYYKNLLIFVLLNIKTLKLEVQHQYGEYSHYRSYRTDWF